MGLILNAGCGPEGIAMPGFLAKHVEVRLDCDPGVHPDILASIVAMPMLKDETFDALYSSHTLEHLYRHEAAMALREFARVLKPGGEVHLYVPDLQSIAVALAQDQLDDGLYHCTAGVITAHDILYGFQQSVSQGNLFMQHKTGYTQGSLSRMLQRAGFENVVVERKARFNLGVRATKAAGLVLKEAG
jgi:predicted SAM-dependent methyltransferase